MDNYSESRIILFSYYMNFGTDRVSLFSNPGWSDPSDSYTDDNMITGFLNAIRSDAQPNWNYVRYWMGFRAFLRPLLAFIRYGDVRQCIVWAFFLLLGAITLRMYQLTKNFWISLGFVFVISQLNPVAITGSIQNATCFLISFVAMLYVLRQGKQRVTTPMLFFLLGGITQFFDFYSNPVLTFCLPMIAALMCLQYRPQKEYSAKSSLKQTLTCFGLWLTSYLLTWLVRLFLIEISTSIHAISETFSRVGYWLLNPSGDTNTMKTILLALYYSAINLTDYIPIVFEAAGCVAYVIILLKRKPNKQVISCAVTYLFVGAIPILWIIVASKPAYAHTFLQYRVLGATMFSVIIFMLQTAMVKPTPVGFLNEPHADELYRVQE